MKNSKKNRQKVIVDLCAKPAHPTIALSILRLFLIAPSQIPVDLLKVSVDVVQVRNVQGCCGGDLQS